MNENRCIVMWREIQYLVVRTSVPPTNNTLLILVPPTPENALEIITIMNPDKMEENECTFMPEYNEIAEQLLKMEVIKETEILIITLLFLLLIPIQKNAEKRL